MTARRMPRSSTIPAGALPLPPALPPMCKVRPAPQRALSSVALPVAVKPRRGAEAILDLTPSTCRWPQGRPGAPDFRFCLSAVEQPGAAYCVACAKRAYAGRRSAESFL
jgi:GcrA cell cycle regulator